ncbi:MAG: helix-turn-helix domain-containing protein [Bacteroidales bacterium]|nr:helix-turn-helix domain-containing protein [Bacteroidales bacterium]MCF8391733.1 helix-turn-helix domain-containing protein [Bacteroidales bacterium]
MKDRLQSILSYYQLNSSKLAEIIDVQRSGISHILSGRNNPSYDFLIRILDAFPEINANWLLTGKGNMINGEEESSLFSHKNNDLISSEVPVNKEKDSENIPNQKNLHMSNENDVYKSKLLGESSRHVEKVIILYSNGKFKEYSEE